MGLDWVYVAFPVPPERLPEAVAGIRALGMPGVNVTIPHKQAIVALTDVLDESARVVGAVNTISCVDGRLTGYNTDGPGLVRSLEEVGETVQGKRVTVFGAGGSSRAIAWALVLAGAQQLAIINRTPSKAVALAELVNGAAGRAVVQAHALGEAGNRALVEGSDIVVDTTAVGMHPHTNVAPIVPAEWLQPGQVVCDITYNPRETVLLAAARARGARVVEGLGMLVHQGAIALEMWTGRRAPVATMRPALEAALAQPKRSA
jgi:shikimate dehydrogenase